MKKKPQSRAAAMAAQYSHQLQRMGVIKPEPHTIETSDEQAPEQIEKLKNAVRKLHTFKDMV